MKQISLSINHLFIQEEIIMKIAVVAGNGRAARKIIAEAVSRGLEVTAFGRRDNNTDAQHYVKKDLFDLTREDLAGFDAVVDAFGPCIAHLWLI